MTGFFGQFINKRSPEPTKGVLVYDSAGKPWFMRYSYRVPAKQITSPTPPSTVQHNPAVTGSMPNET